MCANESDEQLTRWLIIHVPQKVKRWMRPTLSLRCADSAWINGGIIYAVTETNKIVDVLTVRKRPPYDYGDLEELLREIYR
ncbi:MAG: hypothetical protein Fur0044_18660 [Anaerolineae bacterium]